MPEQARHRAVVTEYVCPRGHRATSTLRGVCWNCYPGGRGPAEQEERVLYPEAVFAALEAERDRLYAENVDLRARIAAARARLGGSVVSRPLTDEEARTGIVEPCADCAPGTEREPRLDARPDPSLMPGSVWKLRNSPAFGMDKYMRWVVCTGEVHEDGTVNAHMTINGVNTDLVYVPLAEFGTRLELVDDE